jgi:hypothetical protein
MTGFEPATSASRMSETGVSSTEIASVMSTAFPASAAVSPIALHPDCSLPAACPADFSQAILVIDRLPLSDAEKAAAVRAMLPRLEPNSA